ncbi:MAG TPA: hypothetical protein DCL13_03545 [Peptococcaceae bacterium]|nr:hypothetical protein [Peptococcaceae bacterium]
MKGGEGLAYRLNWLETVFFIFLLLIALFVFLRSAFFNIDTVEVVGTTRLSEQEVKKVAQIEYGTSIFKINTGEVEARLRRLTLVKDASVVRKLPRTVLINIEERRPRVLLFQDNAFWEVDEEGVLLERVSIEKSDLPLATGVRPGDAVWPAVMRVANALDSLGGVRFAEIHGGRDGKITAYTVDGVEIRLGTASEEELGAQVAILDDVLKAAREQGGKVIYVDLSDPRRPVVKYAEG